VRSGALLLAFAVSCASEPPAETGYDSSGWFLAACPKRPDACVKAAEQHCPWGYLLGDADAGLQALIGRPGEPYARQAAEVGYLRLRCVVRAMP